MLQETTVGLPYIDREVSLLEFNKRVLDLVITRDIPLLEKLKFLSIVNSNLDEFFSIRIASGLKESDTTRLSGHSMNDIVGLSRDLLVNIDKAYEKLQAEFLNAGIPIMNIDHEQPLKDTNRINRDKYFHNHIFPVLTPLILDSTRPIPHFKPLSIYIILIVDDEVNGERIGLIEIPPHLPRLTAIGRKEDKKWFYLEDIIIENLETLYPGLECTDVTAFRLLRDSDTTNVDIDKGYIENMTTHIRGRILFNDPVRIDIWGHPRKKILKLIKSSLDVSNKFIFNTNTRLKMSDLMQMYDKINRPELKYSEFKSSRVRFHKDSIMKSMEDNPIIIHHPYQSFKDTVVKFVEEACEDPHVVSIKQTLYRSGNDSKIVNSLIKAAESGKNVLVVMEIKARFDEESNIEWADKLKRAGATVVYGYEDFKTHAKMIHVVKSKNGDTRQYVHIGTGNYNEKNSRIYTDFSYFTSDKRICTDINTVFNMLTGGIISDKITMNKLGIAPLHIRSTLYANIDAEIEKVKNGNEGYICIKVNNIADYDLTMKLYAAAQAGVQIDLIVRGACSVGVAASSTHLLEGENVGIFENIHVKSIVGRFLEHSRVIQFGKDVNEAKIFITSSDLMTRNLDKRVEVLLPITNTSDIEYFVNYLSYCLLDTTNSYELTASESYLKVLDEDSFDSQNYFMEHFRKLSMEL